MRRLLIVLLLSVVPVMAQTTYTPQSSGWHDLGASTAIQPNGVGGANDMCPSNTYGGFGYAFDSNCYNSMLAWNSCIADQAYRRMICTGGGHSDYSGNEIYGIQLGPTNQATRYNGPSQPCNAPAEVCSNPTGPNSRHTYGGLTYMANTHQMFMLGGALAGAGTISVGAWTLNTGSVLSSCAAGSNQTSAGCSAKWTEVSSNIVTTFTDDHTDQPFADYWDSTLSQTGDNCMYVFFPAGGDFGNFCAVQGNNNTSVFTNINFIGASTTAITAAIEQKSGIFVVAGGGELWGISLPGGAMVDHTSASGCSGLANATYPGLAYDEVAAKQNVDDMVGYVGSGQSVVILHTGGSNSATWSCSTETLGSATPPSVSIGVLGRFRYMRLENAFIYVPGTATSPNNAHAWSYHRNLTPSGESSLAYRCANPGVLRCTNFTPTDLVNYDGSGKGSVQADGNGSFANYSRDTSTVPAEATGIGNSFKLIAPATGIGANQSPSFHTCIDVFLNVPQCTATVGPTGTVGNTLYVQVRWRADASAINEGSLENPSPDGGEGWKLFGVHGPSPDSTCQAMGQVIQNINFGGVVQGFQNCGSGANFVYGTDTNDGPTVIWENGFQAESTGYNCGYSGGPGCPIPASFPANTWVTLYCKWVVPNFTANTVVYPNGPGSLECWWQPSEGVALRKIFSFIGWSYQFQNNSSDDYDRVILFNYDTNRNAAGNFAQQTFWYSELIVSTQPIVAPSAGTAATPTFLPVAGSYAGAQSVSINTSSPGAIICYNTTGAPATNGGSGCTTGTLYTGPVTVATSETLYAVAGGTGFFDSAVANSAYTIDTVMPPSISPVAGTYPSPLTVTITPNTIGSTICYTTDGSIPTSNGAGACVHGTTYTGSFSQILPATVQAIGTKSGFSDSSVVSSIFMTAATVTFTGPVNLNGTAQIR